MKVSLQELYNDKCYICESNVGDDYDVEHFLPKKHFPQFGYTWENLHKSCAACNLAKESKPFLLTDPLDSKKVIDILLLDPSSDSYNIYDYISSDINGRVILQEIGEDPAIKAKAKVVVAYLNGELKKGEYHFQHAINVFNKRKDRILSFERFMQRVNHNIKDNCLKINSNISNYSVQTNDLAKQLDLDTLSFLSNLNLIYLNNQAEYSSFVRRCTLTSLNLRYTDILNIIRKLKTLYTVD